MEWTLRHSPSRPSNGSSSNLSNGDVAAQLETLEVLGRAIEQQKRILQRTQDRQF